MSTIATPVGRYEFHAAVPDDIESERLRQIRKWGHQSHDPVYWVGILAEELGEVAQCAIEHRSRRELYEEVTQLAAVAVAMMEDLAARDLVAPDE